MAGFCTRGKLDTALVNRFASDRVPVFLMQTIVIGHKNPDMDAIVSALAYAELKRLTGVSGVVAGRCGTTNERIDFVLGKFGFKAPAFFSDVRPRVEDVMDRDITFARFNSPVYEAMLQIGEKKFRGLPVVDDNNRCVGMISGFKISQYLFPDLHELGSAREVQASLSDICKTIQGHAVSGSLDSNESSYVLRVAAMHSSTFRDRIGELDLPRTIMIVGDRFDIQLLSVEAGVRALVVTGDLEVGEDVLELAKTKGSTIIRSPHDTATTLLLARSAVTAGRMSYSDFESISPEIPLEEAKHSVALSSQFAFPVIDENSELLGILSKSDFLKPVPRQLILVDHNEMSQAVSGAADVPIVEILDHHRLGTISTETPILFLNRPLGSTSTLVATCYQQAAVPIPPAIAGILMAGLISDTLNLTSPTTTDVDREVMKDLSRIAGIDPGTLANEIFSVGSPLLTLSADQAILADCKEYEERDLKFSVAQIEELSFSHFPEKRDALVDALEEYRSKHHLLFSALLVTDINTQNSFLIVRGSELYTKHIDYPEIGTHLWQMDGVVSRKKQLLPYLSNMLGRMA